MFNTTFPNILFNQTLNQMRVAFVNHFFTGKCVVLDKKSIIKNFKSGQHCKKSLSNSPWPWIIKLFPAKESLVSDIPAGDGKIELLCKKGYTTLPGRE